MTDWVKVDKEIVERVAAEGAERFYEWPCVVGTMIDGRPPVEVAKVEIAKMLDGHDTQIVKMLGGLATQGRGSDGLVEELYRLVDRNGVIRSWGAQGTLARQAYALSIAHEKVLRITDVSEVHEIGGGIGLMGVILYELALEMELHQVFDMNGPGAIQRHVWDTMIADPDLRDGHQTTHDELSFIEKLDSAPPDSLFISLCGLSEMPLEAREFVEAPLSSFPNGVIIYQSRWMDIDNRAYFADLDMFDETYPDKSADGYWVGVWSGR